MAESETERQKMVRGELYDPHDLELTTSSVDAVRPRERDRLRLRLRPFPV